MEEFINIHFIKKLKSNNIKGALASKIYKLINDNKNNISEYLIVNKTIDYSNTPNSTTKYDKDIVDQLVTLGYGTIEEIIEASQNVTDSKDIHDIIDKLK